MNEIEAVYRRWIEEVWNKGQEEVIDELFDEEGVAFYPYFVKSDEPIRGINKFKEFYHLVRENFSDLSVETLDLAVEGDRITSLLLIKAVQKNTDSDGLSIKERAELKCLCRLKIRDGKIIEIWNNVDLSNQNPKAALLKL